MDMCRFDLQVIGEGLNKKPTCIMTNHPHLLRLLEGHLRTGDRRVSLGGVSRRPRPLVTPSSFVGSWPELSLST
eukprot:446101-Pyramimonas_sp.AAC.1